MDYGAFPPEFNSARIYAGPGSGPMLAAAAAWDALAAELHSAASSYETVISTLTSGPWIGPSSAAMASAIAPYLAWLGATAGQAEVAGAQAQAAAAAFDSAFAMTVPPAVVAENRVQMLMLVATNFFGQNTAAIAANEAEYAAMWAQDAEAMYGYAANALAATSKVTPFTQAPETTNASGLAAQSVATSQAAGTSAGGVGSTLAQLINAVPNALQSLTTPGAALPASGLPNILGGTSGTTSTASPAASAGGGLFGGLVGDSVMETVEAQYLTIPGLFSMFMASNAIGPLMNPAMWLPFANQAGAQAAQGLGSAAMGATQAFGPFAGMGALPGLGQAASVGALSVPGNWGFAAKAPAAAMLGGMPLAAPLGTVDPNLAAGLGLPLMMGGGPRSSTAAAGSNKYGLPLPSVMTRPPAAGYGPTSTAPAAAAYPVPPGFPTNGHAPPGYQPAIVYVPTTGHASAN